MNTPFIKKYKTYQMNNGMSNKNEVRMHVGLI